MKLLFAVIGICIACVSPVFSQGNRRPTSNCITPDNYYGTCVTLTYCPQITNIFQTTDRNSAQRFLIAAQRSCGTRSVNGDPVICCSRPVTNVRPTQSPVTQAPNPFLPTRSPFVQPTSPPFVQPTNPQPPPTIRPTPPPPTIRPTPPPPTIQPTPPPTVATTSAPDPLTQGRYCRDPKNREGFCAELRSCKEIFDELMIKTTDATFAMYLRASNQICGGVNTAVCCPSSAAVQVTPAPVLIQNSNEIPRRVPTVEEGCGYTANSYKKIVGGEVSKKGAWPWIALIGYDDEFSSSPFKCGGTLITARHIITAAHCIRNDLKFVRLGEHDLTTDAEAKHVDIPVVKYERHPDYNTRNGRSDIAILYLERNVEFSEFIAPICLPATRELQTKSYVKHTPFVVGWGKTLEGGRSANVLQELQIPILENGECKESYRAQNRLFSEDQFDAAVICAGVLSGGKDTCQGDSGGPLMIPESYQNGARYYLIGVVSYGIGCARPDVPGVYSSVQYFMSWILEKVANTP